MKSPESYTPHPALRTRGGFTLVEIMVAMGVFVILGTALVGLMSAAVDAWRRGEAGRLTNEKLQALQRQIADDLAAAVLDPPPAPDFHFALDTLYDLSTVPGDPCAVLDTALSTVKDVTSDTTDGRLLTCFAGPGTVVLRIRVPFRIGAALLQARADTLWRDPAATAQVFVGRNDPTLVPPAGDPTVPDDTSWRLFADLPTEGVGGGEADISPAVQGGDIVFVRAELSERAQFLRSDAMRAGGRPVLILDCYRDPAALPQQPRPTFAAFVRDGAQIITFTRTLPPEVEQAALRTAGSPASPEYLNYADDNDNKQIDETHRPLAGRAQVVYRIQPYHSSLGKPGLGVLRRAFEAPLRQPASTAAGELLTPNVVSQLEEIRSHDFIPNVLYLGMSFWGADTTTWEDRPDLEPGYDTKYDDTSPDPRLWRPRPASADWLSSRYLPEQAQVTVVLEPDRGERTATGLAQAIGADFPAAAEGRLGVVGTRGFDNVQRPAAAFARDPRHFIKVDDEWLFYARIGSPTEFIIPRQGADGLAARGCRGTRPVAHPAGAEVFRGNVAVFTVRIPTYHHWQR